MERLYTKNEVIGHMWKFSRHQAYLLSSCEELSGDESFNGHASLLLLFNITENTFKSSAGNFEDGFYEVLKKLKNQKKLSATEYKFLNAKTNSIRIIRNYLAHANLSAYSFVFVEEDKRVFYSLSENETCQKLYEILFVILFNLILKVTVNEFGFNNHIKIEQCTLENEIKNLNIEIVKVTPEQILESKGHKATDFQNWKELSSVNKYRLAENMSDISMIIAISQQINLRNIDKS